MRGIDAPQAEAAVKERKIIVKRSKDGRAAAAAPTMIVAMRKNARKVAAGAKEIDPAATKVSPERKRSLGAERKTGPRPSHRLILRMLKTERKTAVDLQEGPQVMTIANHHGDAVDPVPQS